MKQVDSPGVFLYVKVTPKASADKVVGWDKDTLKVKVRAAPEKGEANQAVVKLLARHFDIPQSSFTLIKGASCRIKLFLVEHKNFSLI